MKNLPEIQLVMSITNNCNYTCPYCLRGSSTNENIDIETVNEVLNQAKELGIQIVSLTGGEPYLHPEFKDIIRIIYRNELEYGLVTNGTHIDEYKEAFVIQKPKTLTVSLNGSTEQVNSMTREGWQTACNAIREYSSFGIPVHITYTISQDNEHDLEDAIGVSKSLGAYVFWLSGYIPTKGLDYTPFTLKEKKSLITRAIAAGQQHNIKIHCTASFLDITQVPCHVMDDPIPHLLPTGEIGFCCNLEGKGKTILNKNGFKASFGQIKKYGADLVVERDNFLLNPTKDISNCEFCYEHFKNNITHFSKSKVPILKSKAPTSKIASHTFQDS